MVIETIHGYNIELTDSHDNVFMQPHLDGIAYSNMDDFLSSKISPYSINVTNGTKTFNQNMNNIVLTVKTENRFVIPYIRYVIINNEYCYFLTDWEELNSLEQCAYKIWLKYDVWGSNFNAFTTMSDIYFNENMNVSSDTYHKMYNWEHGMYRGTYRMESSADAFSYPKIGFSEYVDYQEIVYRNYKPGFDYEMWRKLTDSAPTEQRISYCENVKVLWKRIVVNKNELSGQSPIILYNETDGLFRNTYTLGSPWAQRYGEYVVLFTPIAAYDNNDNIKYFDTVRSIYDFYGMVNHGSRQNYWDSPFIYGDYIDSLHVIKVDSTFYTPFTVKTGIDVNNNNILVLDMSENAFGLISSGTISEWSSPITHDVYNIPYVYTGIFGAPNYVTHTYTLKDFIKSPKENQTLYSKLQYIPQSNTDYKNFDYHFYKINPYIYLYLKFADKSIEIPLTTHGTNLIIEIEPKVSATIYRLLLKNRDETATAKNPNIVAYFVYSNGVWATYTDKIDSMLRNDGVFKANGWSQGIANSAIGYEGAKRGILEKALKDPTRSLSVPGDIVAGYTTNLIGIGADIGATFVSAALQPDMDGLPSSDANNDIFYQDRFFVYTKEYIKNSYTEALLHSIHCDGIQGLREVNIFNPSHKIFDFYNGNPDITWKAGLLKRQKDAEEIKHIFNKGVTIWYTDFFDYEFDFEENFYFNKSRNNPEREVI